MEKEYKKITFTIGSIIKDAVFELLDYKNKGELVYGEFNGTKLYSDTVTLDSAYKEITEMTYGESIQKEYEWHEEYTRKEKEWKNNIPSQVDIWVEKGKKILIEDKWRLWEEIIPIRLGDLYHGMELGNCLDIVDLLNNGGSLEDAKKMIESQDHSGMSFGLVRSMVKEFAIRGNEFADYVKY